MTPDFRRVLAAEGVSNFGSMLSRLAIPWLAVITLQASPWQMAWLRLADVLAAGIGALLLGAWVDGRGKRGVMLLCDGARCAVLGLLALGAWAGWVGMTWLVLASAAGGVLTLAFELARSAWMAQRVDAAQLPQANAGLSMVGSLSETAAFALGGWLYQGLGATLALLVDACSYIVSALCLRGVREAAPERDTLISPSNPTSTSTSTSTLATTTATAPSAASPSPWRAWAHESLAGLRAVRCSPVLRSLAGIEGLIALGRGLTDTAFMIFVARDLALPTGQLGVIFALGALGAIAGASLAPWLGRRLGAGRCITLGLLAYTLGALCVPLAGVGVGAQFAPWGWGVTAGAVAVVFLVLQQIVGDAGHTLHDVHDRSLRQTVVAPALLARADAGIRSVGHAAMVLGVLAGGLLGDAWGVRPVLWLAAGAAAAAALWAALTLGRGRRFARLPAP